MQTALTADARFRALKQGDHVCAVYSSPDEQAEAMAQYIASGLNAGERCLYILDDRAAPEILERLGGTGVDVAAATDSRRFVLATSRQTYLREGTFDPDAMVRLLAASQEEALAAGCSGLRITGEMTWALGSDVWSERVVEYETRLNEFFPGSRAQAICQYNRARFSPSVIRDVLRTHPIALVGQHACPNPYYEPPHLIRGDDDHAAYVDWMIGHMLAARQNELRLQQTIQDRDHFLSIASHEIRTPLHSLVLSFEALKLSPLGSVEKDVLARAQRQLGRLNGLVGTLLDVSRITERRLTLDLEETDLHAIAAEVVAHFAGEARAARSALELHGEPVVGTWDRHRLDQIVSNLVSNALKYGAGRPVEIEVRDRGESAAVTVKDAGIGIAPDQLGRIFERFSRASSSRHYSGLGLGLWIAKSLVDAMGGEIAVESEIEKGSVFTVILPKRRHDAEPA